MARIAVIHTGGKQYIVKEGDVLEIEKLEAKEGDVVSFDPLFICDDAGSAIKVGKPIVAGATVSAKITKFGRADKVVTAKFHAKTRYSRTLGHRQHFTEIKIEKING